MKFEVKDIVKKLIIAVIFGVAFATVFVTAEKVIDGSKPFWITTIPFDYTIPFVPGFILGYMSWFFFMGISLIYVLFFDSERFYPYALYVISMLISTYIFCLIVPNGVDLRPANYKDIIDNQFIESLYDWLWKTDTPTNVLPSVHVIGSMGVAFLFTTSKKFSPRVKPIVVTISWIWTAIIIASTIFTRQHSILDIVITVVEVLIVFYPIFILYPRWRKKRQNKNLE